jgi:hypothetical protein
VPSSSKDAHYFIYVTGGYADMEVGGRCIRRELEV